MKIKSVKLKSGFQLFLKGEYWTSIYNSISIHQNFVTMFPNDLEIEYEEMKYVDFRIEAESRWTFPNEKTIKEHCDYISLPNAKVTKLGEGIL